MHDTPHPHGMTHFGEPCNNEFYSLTKQIDIHEWFGFVADKLNRDAGALMVQTMAVNWETVSLPDHCFCNTHALPYSAAY